MQVPEATIEFIHRTPVQLRFRDIDMFGHVNNNVYLELMDMAKASFYAQIHGGHLNPANIGLLVVNVNCDFFEPTRLEEPLEILTGILKISERSIKLEQRIINSATGAVKGICRTVLAGFDPKTNSGAPVPAIYHEYFNSLQK